jgi:serine/threonine protein kinase
LTAVKSMNKEYLKEDNAKRKMLREVTILKKVRHPSVVKLFD